MNYSRQPNEDFTSDNEYHIPYLIKQSNSYLQMLEEQESGWNEFSDNLLNIETQFDFKKIPEFYSKNQSPNINLNSTNIIYERDIQNNNKNYHISSPSMYFQSEKLGGRKQIDHFSQEIQEELNEEQNYFTFKKYNNCEIKEGNNLNETDIIYNFYKLFLIDVNNYKILYYNLHFYIFLII